MTLIIDTREQLPLWDPDTHKVIKQKLDEGDYTTEELLGLAHVERKSPGDLYGSLLKGHARFKKEILRAQEKGIKLAIFVECTKSDFMAKRFKGSYRMKVRSGIISKIISSMTEKYNLQFIWCNGRDEMRDQILLWLENQKRLLYNGTKVLKLKELSKKQIK